MKKSDLKKLACKSLKGWRWIPSGSLDFVNRLLVSGTALTVQHNTLGKKKKVKKIHNSSAQYKNIFQLGWYLI